MGIAARLFQHPVAFEELRKMCPFRKITGLFTDSRMTNVRRRAVQRASVRSLRNGVAAAMLAVALCAHAADENSPFKGKGRPAPTGIAKLDDEHMALFSKRFS